MCDIVHNDRNRRLCFFEIDDFEFKEVDVAYEQFNLDVLKHRTQKGYHWLSPTEVDRDTYLQFHAILKHLNPKCPMTTLRTEPNKYPDEDAVWYLSATQEFDSNISRNNVMMCNFLNRVWGTEFQGSSAGHIKFVRYPLPIVRI